MQKVLFVLGPTGVGKSEMAIFLAEKLGGEIISADSVQVYRGLDIGSAKISKEDMKLPHHLIDICDASEEFSVAEFVKLTKMKIEEIYARGKLPIIVGGTNLYVKAFTEGYNFGGADKNDEFRKQKEREIEEKGEKAVWAELNLLSPEMAEKIHPNNHKRMVRAFEILAFGEGQTAATSNYDCRLIALKLPREELYSRINKRVDKMLEAGLIKEVENLLKSGVSEEAQSMRAIGYKEVISYLKNELSKQEMVELIKQHSRNYAKRQLTFLRSLPVKNFDVTDVQTAKRDILKEVKGWKDDNDSKL